MRVSPGPDDVAGPGDCCVEDGETHNTVQHHAACLRGKGEPKTHRRQVS